MEFYNCERPVSKEFGTAIGSYTMVTRFQ
ncbi:hypothetical protein CCACVL1_09536 [Corchorus capsularis]|uniref:Uncharacterized protein n=1 Tax=Corchorus capsularis TaxID=210143 RepID=A0A1R3IVR7_COCAP|nr:hypothetical protein CCACVL1_09536 [Corchorus capsularis]